MKKVLLCIMMLAASLPARAEEKTISLEEVVITATRTEEEISKISANVTVITQEDIKRSTATTVQDLLRSEEGIIIRDLYGTGTKSTVDMRGFTRGLNTVIMMDGRKLNESDLSGVDWNTIPLENIERIEIVRGTESVLYGDNAMAGAINIITKKGYKGRPELVLDARAESYNGFAGNSTFTGGNDWIGYFLLMKHRETSGYRENSNFHATDMSAKLDFKITDYFTLDVAAGYHMDDQGLPGGLTEREVARDRRQSTKPDDHVDYTQSYVDARANFTLGSWGDLEAAYGFNNREFDSSLFYFGTSFDTRRDTETSVLRAKLTVDKKLSSLRNLLIAGIDYYDSSVNNSTTFLGSSTRADITKRETGLYLQDELFITDKLSCSLGYRFTYTKFEDTVSGFITVSDEQKFTEDAYRAGITYNYAKGSKVYASYARGFRLPTTDELFDFTGLITNLKPEKSDTYEAGIVHSFGKSLQARLTAFTMDVKDELFYNPTGGPFGFGANENLGKTRHYGAEAGFSLSATDALTLSGSFTYAEAKFKSGPYDGNDMPLVPNYTVSVGADYRFLKSFLLAANAYWVGKKYLDNDVENDYSRMESYIIANAKLSYTYKGLTAYAGVNNIFNEEFSEYGIVGFGGNKNFYPAPERNFYGGLRIAL